MQGNSVQVKKTVAGTASQIVKLLAVTAHGEQIEVSGPVVTGDYVVEVAGAQEVLTAADYAATVVAG
jgi:hypothetical protein